MRISSIPTRLSSPFVPVILAPFVLFAPIFLAGKALFWGTPILQFVPWWNLAWESLHSGQLPLWNPASGMGAPLLANYQSALLYPPTWIYFGLAGLGGTPALAWGQALLVSLHLALAGAGIVLLTRRLGLSAASQAISGLSYGLSQYLVTRSGFLSINATVAWIPWVLLFTLNTLLPPHSLRQVARSKYWLGLVLVLTLQLLAGHAQTTWYGLVLAGLWAGYWGWRSPHVAQSGWRTKLWGLLRAWGFLILAVVVAACLAAPQLLPTAEYLLQSQRSSAVNYAEAVTYSFWPWRLWTLIAPDLFGSPAHRDYWGYGYYWEDAIYVGLFPLLLAIRSLFSRKTISTQKAELEKPTQASSQPRITIGFVFFLWAIFLIALLLALGQNTPLFPWLYGHVPTFALFQAPTRWMIWAVIALCILAGIGCENLTRPQGRGLYWTRLATAGAFAVSLGAFLAWYFIQQIHPTFIHALALAGMWGVGAGIIRLTAPTQGWEEVRSNLLQSWSEVWPALMILMVAADLIFANWGLNPAIDLHVFQPAASESALADSPGLTDRIFLPDSDERDLKFKRYFQADTFYPEQGWENLRTTFLPNLNLLDHLNSVNNFDPFVPGRYARWMSYINAMPSEKRSPWLEWMGVNIIETASAVDPGGVRFQRLAASTRAHWAPCARPVETSEQAWDLISGGSLDLSQTVILEGAASISGSSCPPASRGNPAQIAWIDQHFNDQTLKISAQKPGWLVLADTWYPGWQARIDRHPAPIYPADYTFRAVQIPAGEHIVTFSYQPGSFRIGVLISLLSWTALISLGAIVWRRSL